MLKCLQSQLDKQLVRTVQPYLLGGLSLERFVTSAVMRYIEDNGLYDSRTTVTGAV